MYVIAAPPTTSAPPITTGGIPPATTHSPPLSNCLRTNAQNCWPTGNNCSGVQCNVQLSSSAPPVVATAEVKERCADPVMVNMSVTPSYQNMFSVPGDGLGSEVIIKGDLVRVEYGRNASHLHFKVGLSLSLSLSPHPPSLFFLFSPSLSLSATDLLMAVSNNHVNTNFIFFPGYWFHYCHPQRSNPSLPSSLHVPVHDQPGQ